MIQEWTLANLVRTYRVGESVSFEMDGRRVEVLIQSKSGQCVSLSIDAPREVRITRHANPDGNRSNRSGARRAG